MANGTSRQLDLDGDGDIVMSEQGGVDSPPTNPSSYASSRHADTDHDMPITTATRSGTVHASNSGLHNLAKQHHTTKLHIFSLPRELREKIYAHVLTTSQMIPWPSQTLRTHLSPNLLLTCKAIQHEATPILYSQNMFQFHHPSDANMFLYNHNPNLIRKHVKRIFLLIKDRDVRHLWTYYLSSTNPYRGLASDFPNLTSLQIRLRSSFLTSLQGDLVDRYKRWTGDRSLRDINHHIEERAPPSCFVNIVAHTRLTSTDIRTLVERFPDELRRVRHAGERGVIFRTESQVMDSGRAHVALEIEAVPSQEMRVTGP